MRARPAVRPVKRANGDRDRSATAAQRPGHAGCAQGTLAVGGLLRCDQFERQGEGDAGRDGGSETEDDEGDG